MNRTRCKFQCISKTIYGTGESLQNNFVFTPAPKGKDDEGFWKYTPSGKFELNCLNPNVDFEIGKMYYLDITEAE